MSGQITQTGPGPWQATGSFGTLSAPGANQSSVGFGGSGHLQLAVNGATAFNDVAIAQSCSNKVLTAVDQAGSAGNCSLVTAAMTDGSVAPVASPVFTGTPVVPGYAQTGILVAGNYAKASGPGTVADSGVNAGPYAGTSVPWFMVPRCANNNGIFPSSANKAIVYGIVVTYPLSTSKFGYYINSVDNTSNTYDVAIYTGAASATNNRLLHTGSTPGTTFAATTGAHSVNWAEGPTVLQPGRYYMLLTSSATSGQAVLSVDNSVGTFFSSGTSGVSITSGGNSPATFTSSGDAWTPASSDVACAWLQ